MSVYVTTDRVNCVQTCKYGFVYKEVLSFWKANPSQKILVIMFKSRIQYNIWVYTTTISLEIGTMKYCRTSRWSFINPPNFHVSLTEWCMMKKISQNLRSIRSSPMNIQLINCLLFQRKSLPVCGSLCFEQNSSIINWSLLPHVTAFNNMAQKLVMVGMFLLKI